MSIHSNTAIQELSQYNTAVALPVFDGLGLIDIDTLQGCDVPDFDKVTLTSVDCY